MISVRFQGKPFNITVIHVYGPTTNAEEAEWFCEDLQDLLELTPKKDTPKNVLFIIVDWNAKVGSQVTPGKQANLALEYRMKHQQQLLLLSHFSGVRLCATSETAAHQAPPSLGFSRQEHWSRLPFPSPMHESEVAQSCPTPSDPMDCSLPGSSVHGISQARVLEWVALPSPE